jgi:quercetin dioxygenase-like cupin family protein
MHVMESDIRLEPWDATRDGELSEEGMQRKLDVLGYYANTYTYTPGTRFVPHTHEVDKIDGVLSGRFRIQMLGCEVILEAGDLVWIPEGTLHSAEVVGRDPVISLDAVRRD